MPTAVYSEAIEVLSWRDVAGQVAALNPEFAATVADIGPSNSLRIYKLKYSYGSIFLKNGLFYVPNSMEELVPVTDSSLPTQLRDDLSYNYESNPISLILKNSSEIYIKLNDRVVPYCLMYPGHIIGTWGLFDPNITHHPMSIWRMSSGARSTFMLPKISDLISHRRLQKEFNIDSPPPKNLDDQYNIFTSIFNNSGANNSWECEILFFSKQWFADLDTPKWAPLKSYFLERIWQSSNYLRNQVFWNLIYSAIQKDNAIAPNPYATTIVKQLFSAAMGATLGFTAATDDLSGPVSFIKDVYVNGPYQLKEYLPTIMIPNQPGYKPKQPSYFSLGHPTALEFSLKLNSRPSLITDLKQIQTTLNQYIDGIINSNLNLQSSLVYQVAHNASFDFFHFSPEQNQSILPTSVIPESDPSFLYDANIYKGRKFSNNGPFIKSCIRVSRDS